jgi:hypothetical protein
MKTIEKVVFDNGVILEKEDMLGLWMLSNHLLKPKVSDSTQEDSSINQFCWAFRDRKIYLGGFWLLILKILLSLGTL